MNENQIWIVGGSSGIGKELALQYAALGRKVVISARTPEKLDSVVEMMPNKISALPLDVTDEAAVEKAGNALFHEGEGPGTVFLNAGIYIPMSSEKFSAKKAADTMNVNYLGTVRLIEKILPEFRKANSGHLVIVASVAGYQGLPLSLAYGPSKAALINLCEALRIELTDTGITVQVVNPGFVKTPLTAGNKFSMPFLMDVDEAARRIIAGVNTKAFEISFPRRFSYLLKFISLLPYFISIPVLRKITR